MRLVYHIMMKFCTYIFDKVSCFISHHTKLCTYLILLFAQNKFYFYVKMIKVGPKKCQYHYPFPRLTRHIITPTLDFLIMDCQYLRRS